MHAGKCMSRREFADAINTYLAEHHPMMKGAPLDHRSIGAYENGYYRWPSAQLREAFRAVTGVTGDVDLGFYSWWGRNENNLIDRHTQDHELGTSARVQALVPIWSLETRASSDDTKEALMDAANESATFLAWAESTNVGEMTIEQMHTDVRRIAHSYLKVPTLPLFARAKTLRDRAVTLLAGHQDPRHTRELYAAAGWSLTLLSWISVDLRHPDAAEDHARAAWICAERADHNALRAWVRATQHTAAFWQNDYSTAAGYAADGLTYSGIGSAELFLSSALALDLARDGDADRAAAELQRAQQVAEKAHRAEDELSGPLTCSVDRAGSLWSDTELALGQADDALALADRAVAVFEAAPEDQRNRGSERMTRLQQVKAHLVLGDLVAAEEALRPVLDTATAHRVRPLVQRVAEVGAMAAGTTDSAARRIRGAVEDFRRDTVTKELSA